MEYILKGGLVYDGTANPPTNLDIHIKDDKIINIAPQIKAGVIRTIDCTGLSISPGWIDAHSHNDFYCNNHHIEQTLPFLEQGITTQIVGNCGFSAYGLPRDNQYVADVGGGLFHGHRVSTLSEFVKETKGKLLQNIIPLVGQGTMRIGVKGKTPGTLTKEELDQELSYVRKALDEGAFGGSIGLMYVPGMFASREELVEFAKVIKEYDGIMTVHPRANSSVALGYPLIGGKPHIEQGLDEVIDIMKESKVRVEYSHLIFVGKSSWKCVKPMLDSFQKARQEGYDIAYDMYPFTYGASVITVVLPSWYMALTPEEKKSPFNRLKLKLIITVTKKLLGVEFSDMMISYIGKDYPQYEGKTVTEIAKIEQKSDFDMYLTLVDLSHGEGRIMFGKYYNEEIIHRLMQDPLTIYMTDAWVESTGTQNGGAFQAFPYFIKRAQDYEMPLEVVIHKMTGLTAQRFQIPNRGLIKVGNYADFTIFNPSEISIDLTDPSAIPTGIHYVIVNGQVAIKKSQYQKVTAGCVVLKKKSS